MEARQMRRPFDDRIVSELRRSLFGADRGLKGIPEMLKTVVEHEIWRERVVEETGEVVTFQSFEEFVTTPPLEGLGADIKTLKNLCRDDTMALDALDEATKGKQGERTDLFNNVKEVGPAGAPVGNSNAYALRKLRKDRPDLHKQVLSGEMSPNKAMVEAGFRQKYIYVPLDPEKAARILVKHFDRDELLRKLEEGRP